MVLSQAQFGAQHVDPDGAIPLPGAAQTYSSAQRALVWRRPANLSGQQATYGSFFNPWGSGGIGSEAGSLNKQAGNF